MVLTTKADQISHQYLWELKWFRELLKVIISYNFVLFCMLYHLGIV